MANVNRSSADMARLAECAREEHTEEEATDCVDAGHVVSARKSVEDCFEFALIEMSERGRDFPVDFVGRGLNDDVYYKIEIDQARSEAT